MKYQPSLPQQNDNISHEHPLKDFLLILVALSVVALAAFWVLGLLVDVVVDRVSPETEARLTSILAPKPPETVEALRPQEAYLQSLVDGMRQCAGIAQPVTVRVAKSEHANALVVPGGTVIVFSGLLDHVNSENGLSFVLAHELSHMVNRDHLRAMGRGIVLVALATLVTGDGSAAASVLAPAQHLGETRYSRGRETAADATALQILQCRYGHVGGATELFEALRKEGDGTPAVAHYLSSHPSMQARIDALVLAMKDAGLRTDTVQPLQKFNR